MRRSGTGCALDDHVHELAGDVDDPARLAGALLLERALDGLVLEGEALDVLLGALGLDTRGDAEFRALLTVGA